MEEIYRIDAELTRVRARLVTPLSDEERYRLNEEDNRLSEQMCELARAYICQHLPELASILNRS